MVRLAIVISVFALLACGGSETEQTGGAGSAAAGGETESAPAPAKTTTPQAAMPQATTPQAAATVDPKVQSCLDLVSQAKFQEALPVCAQALSIDPNNQQVQQAMSRAREESAKLSAAKAAGAAAAEGAAQGATSKLGEATGGMADQPGQ